MLVQVSTGALILTALTGSRSLALLSFATFVGALCIGR
jgi:hypothetical protein